MTGPQTLADVAAEPGGTFMVVTLSGLQEAQRLAEGNSARLIAGMTTAFATGQVLGPILIGVLAGSSGGLRGGILYRVALLPPPSQ